MSDKPGNIILGKGTTEQTKNLLLEYKTAQDRIKAMRGIFKAGLDASALRDCYNPFDCEHRETYIHQTTSGDVHRCIWTSGDDVPQVWKICCIEECPLLRQFGSGGKIN